MSAPAPEKVFPAPASPPSSSSGSVGVGRVRLDKKTAGIVGGAVVVIAGLVAASRNGGGSDETDTAVLDTTDTDVYNDLQAAIEELTDELGDRPRPPKPGKGQGGGHRPPKGGPRPGGGSGTKGRTYRVAKGDKLAAIARKFNVSALNLYRANRKVIEAAARDHGRKSSQLGRHLFAGTLLEIPGKK